VISDTLVDISMVGVCDTVYDHCGGASLLLGECSAVKYTVVVRATADITLKLMQSD
jgi:hypothetical protein